MGTRPLRQYYDEPIPLEVDTSLLTFTDAGSDTVLDSSTRSAPSTTTSGGRPADVRDGPCRTS